MSEKRFEPGDYMEPLNDGEIGTYTVSEDHALTSIAISLKRIADTLASAMSAFGQDPQGLEAKPASATAKPGRPMTVEQLARDSAE